MGLINRLDRRIAELIAAGEVVERPASVVKELVENSIDAGASAVTIEIKNGGMTFLRVTDNGCGLFREDVPTAFLSHATSKIGCEADLECIQTMGFRGEALASVAAVARVELLTRRDEELEGTRYVIDGGLEQSLEAAGCPKGTTILVRDLFYNTPARLKFVKKDISEANAIESILDKIAVSHPAVSIKLIRDGSLKLHTPGDGKLISAVYAVFGREFAKGLTEIAYQKGPLQIQGLLSRPEASRANRSMQNFFINRRYVKSRTCAAALEEAYRGAIMVGKFPACVLNLVLDPHTVDVNVHPAKIEVRFEDEKQIFDLVYFGVKSALAQTAPPEARLPEPKASVKPPIGQRMTAEEYRSNSLPQTEKRNASSLGKVNMIRPLSPPYADKIRKEPDESVLLGDPTADYLPYQTKYVLPDAPAKVKETVNAMSAGDAPAAGSAFADAHLIGEAFATYLFLQSGDQLWIVDKHAAHERILYNQLKQKQGAEWKQALLAPQAVSLSREEYAAALEHQEALASCGFEVDDFGSGTVMVRTTPMWLPAGELEAVLSSLCADLKSHRHDITPSVLEHLYHSVACRAAVKGGNRNVPLELDELVKILQKDETIRHCPHGRPVLISMSRRELEKLFGRV